MQLVQESWDEIIRHAILAVVAMDLRQITHTGFHIISTDLQDGRERGVGL